MQWLGASNEVSAAESPQTGVQPKDSDETENDDAGNAWESDDEEEETFAVSSVEGIQYPIPCQS